MFDFGIKAEWDYQNAMDYEKELAEKGGLSIHQITAFTKLSVTEIEKL